MTPRASNNSGPKRLTPPSPRVADKYAVLTPSPLASHASNALFSSSGCAPACRTLPTTSRRFNAWERPIAPRASAISTLGIAGLESVVSRSAVINATNDVRIDGITKSHNRVQLFANTVKYVRNHKDTETQMSGSWTLSAHLR